MDLLLIWMFGMYTVVEQHVHFFSWEKISLWSAFTWPVLLVTHLLYLAYTTNL